MTDESIDALWVERREGWTFDALLHASGLTADELRELVEYGALMPVNPDINAEHWRFSGHCVLMVRTASRLRHDFDLDPAGLALALTLIGRIRDLEGELRKLHMVTPSSAR